MINNNFDYLKVLLIVGLLLVLVSGAQAFSQITGYVPPIDETESIKGMEDCHYKWNCTEWFACINRKQTRTCTNIGTCPGTYRKPADVQKCLPDLPKQLFDIKLELENDIIYKPNEPTAWVTFESFGTEPAPVHVTYIILDELGDEIYSEIADLIVYTEEFIIKHFTDVYFNPGRYSLVLKINYAHNVKEEFRQDFEVRDKSLLIEVLRNIAIIVVLGHLLAVLFTYLMRKKRLKSKKRIRKSTKTMKLSRTKRGKKGKK